MENFKALSPDPHLKTPEDMALAKLGQLNVIAKAVTAVEQSATASAALLASVATNVYADNAAAIAGGLTVGKFYSTATGEVRIVV